MTELTNETLFRLTWKCPLCPKLHKQIMPYQQAQVQQQLLFIDGITEILIQNEVQAKLNTIEKLEQIDEMKLTDESTTWLNQQLTKPIFKRG